jgi:hypothetical protein
VFQSKQRRRTWSYIASRRQLLHSFAVLTSIPLAVAAVIRASQPFPHWYLCRSSLFFARPCIHQSSQLRNDAQRIPNLPSIMIAGSLAYNISAAGNRYAGCFTHCPGRIGTLLVLFGHTGGTLHCCAPICLLLAVSCNVRTAILSFALITVRLAFLFGRARPISIDHKSDLTLSRRLK